MNKTSLRFFNDIPVRSVWDEETAKWWLCAADVVAALTDSTNPRVYWAAVKSRNPQLFTNCKQLKKIVKYSSSAQIALITMRVKNIVST